MLFCQSTSRCTSEAQSCTSEVESCTSKAQSCASEVECCTPKAQSSTSEVECCASQVEYCISEVECCASKLQSSTSEIESCAAEVEYCASQVEYSAIHEQMQALAAAGVPFELIPGISAFQAATAKLGAELTLPGLVQTIILTRISGRASAVPESEELASLAAHQASLCLYLAARHVEAAQEKLLQHYLADTPVAVCFRIGWPDEKIWVVPLDKMAAITQEENLIRTTLYLISPALRGVGGNLSEARSRLYHPEHSQLS